MAKTCPQCGKKTGMDVGSPDRQGWYKYICQWCKFEWKSPEKPY
jgi:transposase-like protein